MPARALFRTMPLVMAFFFIGAFRSFTRSYRLSSPSGVDLAVGSIVLCPYARNDGFYSQFGNRPGTGKLKMKNIPWTKFASVLIVMKGEIHY